MKRLFKALLTAILILLFLYGLMYFHASWRSDPKNIKQFECTNPFITGSSLIAAHRMGGGDAPEETMMALHSCIESDNPPDILELDLHITKDGELILLHDDTLDRMTDSQYVFGREGVRPEELTLSELKMLNAGAGFQDINGNRPYEHLHGDEVPDELRLLTLEEVLDISGEKGNFLYIIEIKNDGALGKTALDKLHAQLQARSLIDRTVFGTFNGDITEYCRETYPDIITSAGIKDALVFYVSALLELKDYEPPCSVLQVFYGKPYFRFGVNLATARVINYAHEHDMAIQYWTVNDEEDIRYLKSVGADAIMTDYVSLAASI
ncbi:MAG: glycerophosphodiester phosphodiesterase family protein [Bullifex sp.]